MEGKHCMMMPRLTQGYNFRYNSVDSIFYGITVILLILTKNQILDVHEQPQP